MYAYFATALIDGVSSMSSSGSRPGAGSSGSSRSLASLNHTRAPTPAISSTRLITDHITFAAVGRLPTSSSGGQLLV